MQPCYTHCNLGTLYGFPYCNPISSSHVPSVAATKKNGKRGGIPIAASSSRLKFSFCHSCSRSLVKLCDVQGRAGRSVFKPCVRLVVSRLHASAEEIKQHPRSEVLMEDSNFGSRNVTHEDTNLEESDRVSRGNEERVNNGGATIPTNDGEEDDSNENSIEDDGVDVYKIDNEMDLKKVPFYSLGEDELKMYHFKCLDVAFEFYNSYAEKRGFAARKWNVVKNKCGEKTHQTFVCFKEGFRQKKHLKRLNCKREPRAMARCGCEAFFRVRFFSDTGRWHVKAFSDDHNHELLGQQFVGMLPAHRKMDECDLLQMNSMRDAGIGVTQIYGLGANQSGGYERMAFRKRDMYNEIEKQRRMQVSDVRSAFSYLRELKSRESEMFWRHTVDAEGRLEHLFWFRSKWEELVNEFHLQSNEWVRELYDKRKMWATAHIRGNFFAGFRTTSRCEGMHSQVGRQREMEADFESIIGEPILQTSFEGIERSAAKFYTRKLFFLFRPVLERASGVKVTACEQTSNCLIYIVTYKRMESMGIPCEHIVILLHYLEINELPESLILQRWTKNAKQCVGETTAMGSVWRSNVMSLLFECYEVCNLAGRSDPNLDLAKQTIRELLQKLRQSSIPSRGQAANGNDGQDDEGNVRDPARARTKGCGTRQMATGVRGNRRTTCCSICQGPRHNKKTCPLRRPEGNDVTSTIREDE
ncbi:FAR1 DNA-binding domain [Sesbania bispinosa]|nr:FAR1 DNA-binding domain [Sesbania bispinosa]